jgi:hypothetical protein
VPPRTRSCFWSTPCGKCIDCYTIDEDAPRGPLRGVYQGSGDANGEDIRPFWTPWSNKPELAGCGRATLKGQRRRAMQDMVRKPDMTPQVMKFLQSQIRARKDVVTLQEAVHYQRFIPSFGVEFLEIGFPVDTEFKTVALACKKLLDTVDDFQALGRYPANLTVQLRCVKPRATSEVQRRDAVCQSTQYLSSIAW